MNTFSATQSVANSFADSFGGACAPTGNLQNAGARCLHHLIGGMARWFVMGSSDAVQPMQRTSLRQVPGARNIQGSRHLQRNCQLSDSHVDCTPVKATGKSTISSGSHGVLRVLQVQEPGQAQSSVGRMVISGRMADVCAELDRLVAREAALH